MVMSSLMAEERATYSASAEHSLCLKLAFPNEMAGAEHDVSCSRMCVLAESHAFQQSLHPHNNQP